MDASSLGFDFCANRSPLPAPRSPVPRFFLYGEPPRDPGERFVHVETIADRSRLYDWQIRPHGHRALHQVLVIFMGGGEMQAETRSQPFKAPALLSVPAGMVHGFAFLPETEGYVVTFAEALFRDLARQEPAFRPLLVARFREKIETHLRMALTITQYAKSLNVTPARLRAACLEVTGKPPLRVVEERMLLEAKRNLTYTNMMIAEVAYYLGFGDPAYFSRFFSKLAGESAAAFRKRVTK